MIVLSLRLSKELRELLRRLDSADIEEATAEGYIEGLPFPFNGKRKFRLTIDLS